MNRFLFTTTLVLLTLTWAACASANGPACHCFQQRTFDPGNPQAVEPYLLATTANSLMAVAFAQPKRTIVRDKMSGGGDADLWLALGLSRAYPQDTSTLLERKREAGSWARMARRSPPDPERLPPDLVAAFAAGKSDEQLANLVVVATLQRFGLAKADLHAALEKGLTRQELVLASLLTGVSGKPLAEVVVLARAEPGGWALQTEASGLLPDQMEPAWLMLREKQKAAD